MIKENFIDVYKRQDQSGIIRDFYLYIVLGETVHFAVFLGVFE